MIQLALALLLASSAHAGGSGTMGAPNLTKGTQGTEGFSVQELKDAGRQVVVSSAAAVASVTTEALFTMTTSTGFVSGISGTTFSVPAGKTFRIQSLRCIMFDAALTGAAGVCRLRVQANGPCTITSPVVLPVAGNHAQGVATNIPTQAPAEIPDGIELSGGNQWCISHVEQATGTTVQPNLLGFQY